MEASQDAVLTGIGERVPCVLVIGLQGMPNTTRQTGMGGVAV